MCSNRLIAVFKYIGVYDVLMAQVLGVILLHTIIPNEKLIIIRGGACKIYSNLKTSIIGAVGPHKQCKTTIHTMKK